MSHARQLIRDAIADALLFIPGIERRVYRSRVYPMDSASLPGVCVYADNESTELSRLGGLQAAYQRTLSLQIEVYAKASADLDTLLDDFAALIEAKIDSDLTVHGLALDVALSSTELDIIGGDTERPVGVLRLSYDVVYRTTRADPTAVI